MEKYIIDISAYSSHEVNELMYYLPYAYGEDIKIEKKEKKLIISSEQFINLEKIKGITDNFFDEIKQNKKSSITEEDIQVYQNNPINKGEIWQDLIDSRMIIEVSNGVYVYRGLFKKVLNYFRKKIEEFAYQNFSKVEFFEPSVLQIIEHPEKNLEPQNNVLSNYYCCKPKVVLSHISDIDALKFSNCLNFSPLFKLNHASCCGLYPTLSIKEGRKNKLNTFLVNGKCFRNEDKIYQEVIRLNEFSLLEIVFWGERSEIRKALNICRGIWDFFSNTFHLNAKVKTASDSFIGTQSELIRMYQLLNDSKLEYQIEMPYEGNFYAASSINVHRSHFVDKYKLKYSDTVETACIGFGLERLTYLFLCQKGLKTDKWDQLTYNEIKKYINLEE